MNHFLYLYREALLAIIVYSPFTIDMKSLNRGDKPVFTFTVYNWQTKFEHPSSNDMTCRGVTVRWSAMVPNVDHLGPCEIGSKKWRPFLTDKPNLSILAQTMWLAER